MINSKVRVFITITEIRKRNVMGNIINDIVEDINIKPNKNKLVLKWVISIACSLIAIAFVLGQFKSAFFNRMDVFESTLNKNTEVVEQVIVDMNVGFTNVDLRINKVYTDGFTAFEDHQRFSKKQLILVLDYGQTNKELLKEMLELNMQEKTRSVETQIQQAMTTPTVAKKSELSISVKPFTPEKETKDYISLTHMVETETNDTVFNLVGATKDYIYKIDRNKYQVGTVVENATNPYLFDVNYRNK